MVRLPRQGGFTLPEMMVAVAISTIVISAAATVILRTVQFYKKMAQMAEVENVRGLVRQKVRCDLPCSQAVGAIPHQFGTYQIMASCDSNYNDLHVEVRATDGSLPQQGLLGIGDGYPCKPDRAANCAYGCHAKGEILSRGYFNPPLDAAPGNVGCQLGVLVGVDFATHRGICADDAVFGPVGPLCKDSSFPLSQAPGALAAKANGNTLKGENVLTIAIAGTVPCQDYEQVRGNTVDLRGVRLQVKFPADYRPWFGEKFVIVLAHTVTGRFANAQKRVTTDGGSFAVLYSAHEVVLSSYQPDPPSGAH